MSDYRLTAEEKRAAIESVRKLRARLVDRAMPRVYEELAPHDLPNLMASIMRLADQRGWSVHEALWSAIDMIDRRVSDSS